jgi:transaldolase/glucose-6-phosphate isomerase
MTPANGAGSVPAEHQHNRLRTLIGSGQSVWLDFIDRSFLASGGLDRLVEQDHVGGVTSNPSIFEKAIGHSAAYDDQIRSAFAAGGAPREVYETLVIADVTSAADVLLPVYQRQGGQDGYVSIEVSPECARDTDATIAEARRFWSRINRPNLMIKVPGTQEGLPAIRQLIADGINVNVTLLFSVDRYKDVLEAYLGGLEERVGRGLAIDAVAGVASFFVSRIDSVVDRTIDDRIEAGDPDAPALRMLKGKVAIASAKMAYQHFLKVDRRARWRILADKGALSQRLLWASTGTKNPAYSDVFYVENLVGPGTINTMPPPTLDAFRDHGTVAQTLTADSEASSVIISETRRLGINLDAIVAELVDVGVRQFAEAATASIDAVRTKQTATASAKANA